jgi:hypothetical protein
MEGVMSYKINNVEGNRLEGLRKITAILFRIADLRMENFLIASVLCTTKQRSVFDTEYRHVFKTVFMK